METGLEVPKENARAAWFRWRGVRALRKLQTNSGIFGKRVSLHAEVVAPFGAGGLWISACASDSPDLEFFPQETAASSIYGSPSDPS